MMLFKVRSRKILTWIILLIFITPMIIVGVALLFDVFYEIIVEPSSSSMKQLVFILLMGIFNIAISCGLLYGQFQSTKDVLEVYPDYFVMKHGDSVLCTIPVRDTVLRYTDEHEPWNCDAIYQYCLMYNQKLIQVFTNEFENIDKLCSFCIENHVSAIEPATWGKCKKHLISSIIT